MTSYKNLNRPHLINVSYDVRIEQIMYHIIFFLWGYWNPTSQIKVYLGYGGVFIQFNLFIWINVQYL